MKKLNVTLLLLLSLHAPAFAQYADQPKNQWQQYFEQIADYDDIEDNNMEDMYERLCELEASPINLNTATADDLKQLSFLNSTQIEELTEYLDRYRPLQSMGELSMLQTLDPVRLNMLQCFVFIGNEKKDKQFPDVKDILKYGKHELVATASIPFYERKGDRSGDLGYQYKHWMRYTFKFGRYVQAGITGAQDAGEPFFANGNNMGYDHYAYYAIARKLGCLKTLALGQYKVRLGMGLIMNTGFALGKTTSLVFSSPTNNISPNASRSDAYYLQGTAATIALGKHTDITAFASYRKIDATLNDDGSIRTLLHTGYHRTISEIRRKHNSAQWTTGAAIRWQNYGLHLGANTIYTTYNRELHPNTSQLFRLYDPKGKSFYNGSIDYGFINSWLNINGETALNNEGAIATINSISLKACSSLTLTAIQRFYSYRYYSLFSSSFSDGGKVQNESGIYLGAKWSPLSRLSILAYSDYAYFPWARYTASKTSHSWDNMLQTTYTISRRLTLSTRYRLRIRQQDYNNAETTKKKILINKTEHRARLSLAYNGKHFNAKTQIDGAYAVFPSGMQGLENSCGGMIMQTIGYNHDAITVAVNVGYFNTQDYNSRIYAYERSTLYSFNFPIYYGEGMRGALFVRGSIGNSLIIIGKVGTTKYFDRDVISSSYQQINSSWKTDMDLQVKWKF